MNFSLTTITISAALAGVIFGGTLTSMRVLKGATKVLRLLQKK